MFILPRAFECFEAGCSLCEVRLLDKTRILVVFVCFCTCLSRLERVVRPVTWRACEGHVSCVLVGHVVCVQPEKTQQSGVFRELGMESAALAGYLECWCGKALVC